MRVLFLALGGNRRLAAIEESRAVAEAGGNPVVLVSGMARWEDETFAPGVDVVPLSNYRKHWPLAAEHLVLFRGPRFLLRRVAGFGTARADRVVSAYDRGFANRVHRRAFRPVYVRLWHDGIHRQLDAFLVECGLFDAIVVADARSFPAAQRVVEQMEAATGARPRIAFRVDQLLAPATPANRASAEEAR
jgi:hypothetical protein